jgi:hypothetical protein
MEADAPTASLGSQVIAEEAEVAETEVLHDFVVGEEQISLIRTVDDQGDDFIMLQGSLASNIPVGVIDRLREQEPELTFLELFQTLAPAGLEPKAALVRFHDVQARAFGRTDLSVRQIQFDKNVVVEKSAATCTTWSNATAQSVIGPALAGTSNQANMPGGGNMNGILCHAQNNVAACHISNIDAKFVAVCNDGPAGEIMTKGHWRHNNGSWQKDANYVVYGPGTRHYRWFPRTGDIFKKHVLGIEVVDKPDLLGPAYYVRARDAF